ncbi:unnamed protein product [Candida parapsilosis]
MSTLLFAGKHTSLSAKRTVASCYGLATKKSYSYPSKMCRAKSSLSSMDSDLEAFSHNPADGSFAALPDQTAAKTNYSNERTPALSFNRCAAQPNSPPDNVFNPDQPKGLNARTWSFTSSSASLNK